MTWIDQNIYSLAAVSRATIIGKEAHREQSHEEDYIDFAIRFHGG